MELPKPIIQAFLLADNVYRDIATGKHIIAGTFTTMWAPEFPAKFDRPVRVFLSLTNCRGDSITVQFRLMSLADNTVVMKSNDITFNLPPGFSPLSTLETTTDVPPIPMPSTGVYAFEALVNGQIAGAIRLQFNKIKLEEEGDEQ